MRKDTQETGIIVDVDGKIKVSGGTVAELPMAFAGLVRREAPTEAGLIVSFDKAPGQKLEKIPFDFSYEFECKKMFHRTQYDLH